MFIKMEGADIWDRCLVINTNFIDILVKEAAWAKQ